MGRKAAPNGAAVPKKKKQKCFASFSVGAGQKAPALFGGLSDAFRPT